MELIMHDFVVIRSVSFPFQLFSIFVTSLSDETRLSMTQSCASATHKQQDAITIPHEHTHTHTASRPKKKKWKQDDRMNIANSTFLNAAI